MSKVLVTGGVGFIGSHFVDKLVEMGNERFSQSYRSIEVIFHEAALHPTSIYAITKSDQEEICLTMGRAYGIPTIALRYFNVYGPRQSLNNPYTGICAIFSSRIKNNNPPLIFEDGLQSRDFVSVHDIGGEYFGYEKFKCELRSFQCWNRKADKYFGDCTGAYKAV